MFRGDLGMSPLKNIYNCMKLFYTLYLYIISHIFKKLSTNPIGFCDCQFPLIQSKSCSATVHKTFVFQIKG